MKAHELFRLLSSDEITSFVRSACEDDNVPDKIAGGVLTYQNISLKRLGKLPEETRKAYVRRTLRDKRAAELAIYVLSAALVRREPELIATFLSGAGLPHEGPHVTVEGEIAEPPAKKVDAAVDALLAGFPARRSAIYLHAFVGQPDVSWPALERRLAGDERLQVEDRSAS
ncbi:MAG TPA: hypothetical protein VL084_12805 [Thermoanaerobaculia bacterium]|nr:hypothetical protein [Thermoanaerobaculia bacterium]